MNYSSSLRALMQRIDRVTNGFIELAKHIDDTAIQTKPSSGGWSIAEIILHLIRVNSSYFPVMDQVRSGTYREPLMAKLPLIPRLLGNLIHASVLPDRKRKTRTFPLWEPAPSLSKQGLMGDFLQHQAELKRQISSSEEKAATGVIIASPANHIIVYRLDKAFEIIVSHEERHLTQAVKAAESFGIPSGNTSAGE